MPLHSRLGFISVHDLLAIQEDRDALPVRELSLQKGSHLTTEDLNPILGLWVQGRWADHRASGGSSYAKHLRFRGLLVVLLVEHIVPGLREIGFCSLRLVHDGPFAIQLLVPCLQDPWEVSELLEVADSLHSMHPLVPGLVPVQATESQPAVPPSLPPVIGRQLVLQSVAFLSQAVLDCLDTDPCPQGVRQCAPNILVCDL